MLGGTTDGPGAFDFTQGTNSSSSKNPLWRLVGGRFPSPHKIFNVSNDVFPSYQIDAVTSPPNAEQAACQYPKPVLLNTV